VEQLTSTANMSFNATAFIVWATLLLLRATNGLQPDLPLKQCQEEFSAVTLTSTRLEFSTALFTVANLDLKPAYVTVTTTTCEPFTVTHTETVSEHQAPHLAYTTHYVTELNILEKNRAYTRTIYQPQTITITYSATQLEDQLTQLEWTTTSTTVSTISLTETVSSSITETVSLTQADVFTSLIYVPVFVTRTMTNAWPIHKTVYQTEYIKETVNYVATAVETSTVYNC